MPVPASQPPFRAKLVVIEDARLASMADNASFVKEFPFLAGIAAFNQRQGKNCQTCGRAAQERGEIFAAAKSALAGMDSTRKRLLKEMLNADKVRVTHRLAGSGKRQELTF